MNQLGQKTNTQTTAKIVYVLYLLSTVIGLLGLVGVIMAYVNRDDAPYWLQTHYRFQVRTFWIGLAYLVPAVLLTLILIGYALLLVWAVWLIIRSLKGLKALNQQQPHPKPSSWLF